MNFSPSPRKLREKSKLTKNLQYILFFFIRHISLKNSFSQQNFSFVSFLSAFLLLILFRPTAAGAVSIQLDGTRTVLSGADCGVANYRFGSSTLYTGQGYTNQAVDLLVEVLAEDNDTTSNCIIFSGNSITVSLVDADAADNFAYMDLKITVVKKGTTIPIEVDRLAVSGFDLDTGSGTGSDDIYFKTPDGTFISPGSSVTATTGSFFTGQYQTKLKGSASSCNDSPATGGSIDVNCRGAAMFVNGANGPNTVSSVNLRVQNDNASSNRVFQLSFDFSYIDQLITNITDYGDAASSYGAAGVGASTALSLGSGVLPDNETTNQFSATANGDDTDGSPTTSKFDDEDAVTANNLPLDNQTLFTNTTTNLNVKTFGPGYLSAWLDLNKNGVFDTTEKVVNDLQITSTTVFSSTVPIIIPGTATAGNTAIRFRFTSTTGVAATNTTVGTLKGEVEDYQIAIARYDYGDAPALYGDASHDIPVTPTVYLGSVQPDKELGTQLGADAGATAAGDDANGTPDDEDGITTPLPSLSTTTNSYSLTTTANNTTGSAANVYAWLDFDRDGKFDGDERATVSNGTITLDGNGKVPTGSNGTVTLTWNNIGGSGANIVDGNSYARIRLTTDNLIAATATTIRDLASIGAATNGEVEDYPIAIAKSYDYGDAPTLYGDASHEIFTTPTVYLGSVKPDKESGTQLGTDSGAAAAGDDNNGDDEDAFTALANVPTVGNYNLTVPVHNTSVDNATLHAWIDFNKNGQFELGEYKSAAVANNSTSASLNWTVPTGTLPGSTHARFRLTTDNTLTDNGGTSNVDERSIGNVSNGEVEDYPVSISIPIYDYGDAPDTGVATGTGNYQTTASDGGAAQVVINTLGQVLSLGNNIDIDDGSLQNSTADADDNNGTSDDEDGVSSFPALTTTANQTYTVPVSVQNNVPLLNAFLVGYIDFNKDGDFNDTGEKSATVTVPTDSSNPRTLNVTFTTPTGVTAGNTYARFRLGSVQATAESATGASVSTDNGEVEDYQIAIAPPIASDPNLLLVKRITAINPGQANEIQFNDFVNDGPSTDDEAANWPDSDSNPSNNINDYLRGAISVPQIKPGDEVEYTIYFLSNGDVEAKNIQICDVVPDNMTFNKNSYGTEVGMSLALNATTLLTIPNTNLSNLIDTDEGSFYAPGTNPPIVDLCKKHDPNPPNTLIPINSSNNLSGVVLINLSNPLPAATSPGVPTNSYGFIRFRAKVK